MSSLVQLQDLASRQQEQIESNHRLMVSKEHRLSLLTNRAFHEQQQNSAAAPPPRHTAQMTNNHNHNNNNNSTQQTTVSSSSSASVSSSSASASASTPMEYEANLAAAKERLALQEAKIRQLQLLRAQIGKQRGSNANICKCTTHYNPFQLGPASKG